jgi:hypothetical protein
MVNRQTIDPAGTEKVVVDTHDVEEPAFVFEPGSQAKWNSTTPKKGKYLGAATPMQALADLPCVLICLSCQWLAKHSSD